MSKKSVFCIATSRPQVERIVDRLKAANFSSTDISVLFPDNETSSDFAHEKNTKAPEGVGAGASTGGGIGGLTGGLIGLGIPEIEATRYDGKISKGNLLISVHTESLDEVTQVTEILTAAGAEDICTTGDAVVPAEKAHVSPSVAARAFESSVRYNPTSF